MYFLSLFICIDVLICCSDSSRVTVTWSSVAEGGDVVGGSDSRLTRLGRLHDGRQCSGALAGCLRRPLVRKRPTQNHHLTTHTHTRTETVHTTTSGPTVSKLPRKSLGRYLGIYLGKFLESFENLGFGHFG